MSKIGILFSRLIMFGIDVSIVWAVFWMWDPRLDTHMIWFIAFLFALILNEIRAFSKR